MQQGFKLAALAVAIVGGSSAAQAVTFTTGYTQNFNSLAATGTGTLASLPEGWTVTETGTAANGTYTAGNGSSQTGDTYSFGVAGDSDRALGTLLSGALVSTINAVFTFTGESAVSELAIAYAGEQWRLGATGRADRLDFSYSLDGTTYTPFDALTFSSPVTTGATGALNGNLDANRSLISASITGLNLTQGDSIYFRWSDFNAAGSDDGLGIDNFSLTPTFAAAPAVPEPTTWAMMIGGMGLAGGMMRRRKGATSVRFA